ncbi:transforming acidic coiled-coil-containing protein 3 isoform X2 [Bombus pascuorum]|uniref:transforming acidic coiled-coil-containing protein 3 isoform X2 n=1 Tax=Bombus pascuorum TaxID=65598 RepID=UPI00212F6F76|nr:transforming acidic coiled-coil-containing protein 3 isoform X2 [Bombus pascuorum]
MEYINKLLHRAAAIPARTLLPPPPSPSPSPSPSPTPPSGGDNSTSKSAEHEVKVRFAREFADVGSITYSAPESLSSASSFQSLSSTLSTKSSSGICADSAPQSPNQVLDDSYVDSNISGLGDLIAGCAGINLNSEDDDHSYSTLQNSQDFSHDQTFASATDELSANITKDLSESPLTEPLLTESRKIVQVVDDNSTLINSTEEIKEIPIVDTICIKEPLPVAIIESNRRNSFIRLEGITSRSFSANKSNESSDDHQTSNSSVNSVDEISLPRCIEESNLNSTVCLSPNKEVTDVLREKESSLIEDSSNEIDPLSVNFVPYTVNSVCNSTSVFTEYAEEPSLPSIPTFSSLLNSTDSVKLGESNAREDENNVEKQLARSLSPVNNSNIAVISSPQIAVKSPIQDKSQDINSSLTNSLKFLNNDVKDYVNVINDKQQTCLDDTSFVRSKTPEVQENSATNICQEIRKTVITESVVNNLKLASLQEDTLKTDTITPRKEEVETSQSDKSFDKKVDDLQNTDDLLKADDLLKTNLINSIKENENENVEEQCSDKKLDTTIILEDISLISETIPEEELYTEFKPQRQSTTLTTLNIEQPNFEELQSAAEQVANDICKSSLEFSRETDCFISATSEIFQDPSSFDFLINHGNSKTINRLRSESLYVKFDPLVANTSMLPQGNIQSINEEQNGKSESIPVDTPKRNPAIAAIDRLLFYSPICTNMTQKTDELQEKMASKEQPAEESKSDTPLITDVNMSKELELVRTTVLQLEEELEKRKKEYEAELDKQKNAFQEKINKLQAQMAQEIKSKSQMTVVVEEYEKSISRLLTERERDRTNFEQEKAKLQEELQATNVHLSNTEAAFNDVHQKYEKLKGFVSVYKSNEAVLKEGIQENMETIKGLETRYDQLKNHAKTELEKANFQLDAIRKQHEDETVKLHALVRKAELKSNSLAELVEQKTKENKELTQILDEVIARVGHQNAE